MLEFTTKGGARLRYLDLDLRGDWDSGPGRPVVLIHGLGCDWRVWRRQIGWLAHARQVVAPNIRGSGQSGWRALGWTTADMAADVHDLVLALGLDQPAVAGIFAAIPAVYAEIRDAQLKYIETHTLKEIAEERMAVAFTEDADPRLRAWMIDMIASGQIDGYRSQARPTLRFDFTDRLGEISAPTTVLHGAEDRTVPPFLAEHLSAGIPESSIHLIEGQGHFSNLEAPARFNPLLARALGVSPGFVPAQ